MPPSTPPPDPKPSSNAEQLRLAEEEQKTKHWRRWGTYLSERQWGTVREDYSADGSAWDYFSHEHSRSRAYRWGEDGLAGFGDEKQNLCLGMALWNGQDAILKERLFGLTNSQGNHGEDVKELYYYLDNTPTCSYARMLYKYPQAAFPYEQLLQENQRRGLNDPEYELMDTGIFADNRYFDVYVEYAKADPEDVLMRVTVYNRASETATLTLLPQIWFRNTWSWGRNPAKPSLSQVSASRLQVTHVDLGSLHFDCDPPKGFLFCENETNVPRVFHTAASAGYFKDAFHDYVVHGIKDAVNPEQRGTKAAALYEFNIPAQGSAAVRCGCGRLMRRVMPFPTSTRYSRIACVNAMNSTSRSMPVLTTKMRAACSGRRSPECCGTGKLITTTFSTGCRAIRDSLRRHRSATAEGTTIGFR